MSYTTIALLVGGAAFLIWMFWPGDPPGGPDDWPSDWGARR